MPMHNQKAADAIREAVRALEQVQYPINRATRELERENAMSGEIFEQGLLFGVGRMLAHVATQLRRAAKRLDEPKPKEGK